MLTLTSTNRVTFNVNVFGTAATPTVRCILGEGPGLSFPATKLQDGQYEVLMDLPKDLKVGAHPFKVEVLLNGRLFTPVTHSVEVTGGATNPVPPVVAPAVPVATPESVAPAPTVSLMASVTETGAKSRAAISALEALAKKPVEQRVAPKHEPVRAKLTMADIAMTAEAIEPTRKPKKAAKVPEAICTPTVPVTMTKGAIIYK
jgi:hypothetical protein